MPVNRAVRPTDYPQLQQIQSMTLDEPVPSLLEAASNGTISAAVRELECGTESVVVGYIILVPDTDSRTVHIPELAVHPDHQRAGHGSALVEHACLTMGEYDRLSLTVRKSDTTARQFYEAVGFEVIEKLPGYFESGDGLLLQKELTA